MIASLVQQIDATQIGLWVATFLLICALSFVFADTLLFRIAENTYIGVSTGYMTVLAIKNLLDIGITPAAAGSISAAVAVILGLLYFTRLYSPLAFMSKWPISLMVGIGYGLALTRSVASDLLRQVTATIVEVTSPDMWANFNNLLIVIFVMASTMYFIFTVEHKGPLSPISKLGRLVLMATFGVGFGNALMGRITLLIGGIEAILLGLGLV